MLDTLKTFFSDLFEGDKGDAPFDDNDYRLSVVALLVHAAAVDGSVSVPERAKLHALVQQRFDLTDALADELIAQATAAEQEAIDLYRFTSLLNRKLDEDGRVRLVEMMWQIVYVDGKATEFEDNLIWRTADLLHVSADERIATRRRVAREQKHAAQQHAATPSPSQE